MKIINLSILGVVFLLSGCSIGANSSYCESGAFGRFFYYDFNKGDYDYKNAGVCDNAYKIISNRSSTLEKAYKDYKNEE
ncbi:hypothetical protein BKH46_08055 [Helicobacter sp. 12S02634-8]|uniref:hypothetical protein n=1 Tax=Helicobacter sp. 12S02634-8 TaxID=1476199 RepID=UPI000BA5A735|nr:hypothetical protein [Helicobacter sp. 12S02634-8]PAF46330.1 hypothetical protein BKH46_08055 [Helicobacter sp. 12S02634-8]